MKLILASGSPRRKMLLENAGIEPKVHVPEVDETPIRHESPRAMVKRLARLKAQTAMQDLVGDRKPKSAVVVISADTTVVTPDGRRALGKPETPKEAVKMLRLISGKTHTVLTAYCIGVVDSCCPDMHVIERVVSTKVSIRKLSDRAIRAYVATGEPKDKAGAYAAQGIGMTLVSKISGSWTNVVGLPMAELLEDLESHLGIQVP